MITTSDFSASGSWSTISSVSGKPSGGWPSCISRSSSAIRSLLTPSKVTTRASAIRSSLSIEANPNARDLSSAFRELRSESRLGRRLADRESSLHAGGSVSGDRADVSELAGLAEDHLQSGALARLQQPSLLTVDLEVMRELAFVDELEDDRPLRSALLRKDELEFTLAHGDCRRRSATSERRHDGDDAGSQRDEKRCCDHFLRPH